MGSKDESSGVDSGATTEKTCQGGMVRVDTANLAVISHPYERNLMSPWQSTKLSAANGASTTIDEQKGWKGVNFFAFGDAFAELLGPEPFAEVLAEKDFEFAHEGPVFLPKSNEVFFVSNRLGDKKTEKQCVKLFAIEIDTGRLREIETREAVPQANGATAYEDGVALLAQGQQGLSPGGIIFLDPYTGEWEWLINNWFGLDFNSPNDIVYTPDSGALWFTDPSYASSQGFKATPKLGEYVWRVVPGGASPARMVADGFERPNGLALSADRKMMYVTDTGMMSGADEPPRGSMPRTIYAYDLVKRSGGEFLANRRVFALADCGIPDGIKLDRDENVYSGCGDGLNVWAPNGDLIGKICVPGGVSNFCFAGNELILLAETRVLKIHLRCTGNCH